MNIVNVVNVLRGDKGSEGSKWRVLAYAAFWPSLAQTPPLNVHHVHNVHLSTRGGLLGTARMHELTNAVAEGLAVLDVAPARKEIAAKISCKERSGTF